MAFVGRAFNVDDALGWAAVQSHQRNGSAYVPAGTSQALRY
ncbi:hypothetical protein BHMPCIPO_06272 [Ensifer sesbaniae]|nr:hypothetical protein [Ensifer sesbaniae]